MLSTLPPHKMTALPSRSLLDGPQDLADSALPVWWQEGRRAAWQKFQAIPLPKARDEAFRFANITRLKVDGYAVGTPVSAADREQILQASVTDRRERPCTARIIHANDEVFATPPLPEALARQGVIWETLPTALANHGELLKKYFMQSESGLGAQKFSALHRAWCRSGVFLYVPKHVEIKEPFEAFSWLTGHRTGSFPHTLIVAEAGSRFELVDFCQSVEGASEGFSSSVSDLYIGPGARVKYVRTQNLDLKGQSYQLNHVTVDRDAALTTLHLNLGSHYARTESKSRLIGPGALSEMLSLTLSTGTQEFDQRTFQEHAEPNTTSDLLYKNALFDDSRTIFAGMIAVDPKAQKTNAYQSNRNLLLSTTAEANSLPGLEILANDVRCTHGATTSQIQPEEMFYLRSRGLPSSKARELLVFGFFEDVLNRLKDPTLSQELMGMISQRFYQAQTARPFTLK